MSITCRELIELLVDFLDGSLPDDQRSRLEKHLCDCPPCEYYLQSYRETIRLTKALPCEGLPPELAQRLQQFLKERIAHE